MNVCLLTDNTFKDLEDEINANYKIVSENPDFYILLFRNDEFTLYYIRIFRQQSKNTKIFIKPNIKIIDQVKDYENIYFINTRDKDPSLFDFKFQLSSINMKHVDICLRCTTVNLFDELVQEMNYVMFLIGKDIFKGCSFRVSRNSTNIHCNFFEKRHEITGSIFISILNKEHSLEHVVRVFDVYGNKFEIRTPENCNYFDRFGSSLCYLFKKANSFWAKEQVTRMNIISSKIKSIRGLVVF
jgi:hypothetical protein